jgi:hypothetical protein
MEFLARLISKNAYSVILTFGISLVANILQISTYLRDRRRSERETADREQLLKQLAKYQYIVGLAERNIKTEEQLEQVEKDILQRTSAAKDVENRIAQMQQVAQQQMVQNAIDKSVQDLVSAYEDVKALRQAYEALGPMPDIPAAAREEIEREVAFAIKKPYELPKAFVFRALLLLLLAILLPWPVNTVITLIFLHVFLALFFEAADMYSDTRVSNFIFKHANAIGRWSAVGLWYVLLNFAWNVFAGPIESFFHSENTWNVSTLTTVTVALIGGMLHWRAVSDLTLPPSRRRAAIPEPAAA